MAVDERVKVIKQYNQYIYEIEQNIDEIEEALKDENIKASIKKDIEKKIREKFKVANIQEIYEKYPPEEKQKIMNLKREHLEESKTALNNLKKKIEQRKDALLRPCSEECWDNFNKEPNIDKKI